MKRTRRIFTPEQKANIVNQIDTDRKNGLSYNEAIAKQNINSSLYLKWRRQLAVGISSSLRNSRPRQRYMKIQNQSIIERVLESRRCDRKVKDTLTAL